MEERAGNRATPKYRTDKHHALPAANKNVAGEKKETHRLFDFLNKKQPDDDTGLIGGFGGLLLIAQGEDYEGQAFANRMKRQKRRKKL